MEGMPIVSGAVADMVARGVCRHLAALGCATLTEFRVGQGRRVDVVGLDRASRFTVVEIKSSETDFRADGKWPDYLPFADRFYFAVPEDFPRDILPAEHGLIVADGYGAPVLREAPETPMNGTRRRAQLLRFARTAGVRLHRAWDPGLAL